MTFLPFNVTIRNREALLYEGEALALSSYNSVGPFDILGHHTPFITAMQKQLTILLPNKEKKTIEDTGYGIIHVLGDEVKVFVGL